jgi:hypothetical protein
LTHASAFACAERDEVLGPAYFAIHDEPLRTELVRNFPVIFAVVQIIIIDENHGVLFHTVS